MAELFALNSDHNESICIKFDPNAVGLRFMMSSEDVQALLGEPDNVFFNLNDNRTLQFYKYSMSLIFERFDTDRLIKVELHGDQINYNGFWLGRQREKDVKEHFEKLGYVSDGFEELSGSKTVCYSGIWLDFKYDRFDNLMISYYGFDKKDEIVFCLESDKVDFVPGKSLGDISFGMRKNNVDAILGNPDGCYTSFNDVFYTYNLKRFSTSYSTNGFVDNIITSSPSIFFDNINLSKHTCAEVIQCFSEHGFVPRMIETAEDGVKIATFDEFILVFRFDKLIEVNCFTKNSEQI